MRIRATNRSTVKLWAGDVVRSLREHCWLGVLVLAYALVALAVAAALGDVSRISLMLYNSRFNELTVVIGAGFLIVRAFYIMLAFRPLMPIEAIINDWSKYLTPRRLCNAAPAVLLLSVSISVFTSLKHLAPLIHPYDWDTRLVMLDQALHFGVPPWRLLQPILGYPPVTGFISVVYGSWIFVLAGCWFWQAFTNGDPRLRMQFFVTFILCFALLSNLVGTWLASGGPCFYGRLVSGQDPYSPLMDYLRQANEQVPLNWSFAAQEMLWTDYMAGALGVGGGISAMPSMHLSGATLCALLGWRANRKFGITVTVYTATIMIGSVHLGWHYAIDGYVAILGTLVIWSAVGGILRRFG